MRVHHLNCISSCPLGGHLMDGGAESILHRGHLANHTLLIEANRELILIDTGFGLEEVRRPKDRLSRPLASPVLKNPFRASMPEKIRTRSSVTLLAGEVRSLLYRL